MAEGDVGATTTVLFTVSLFPSASTAVSVVATTADGTATAGSDDYVAKTATITLLPRRHRS